MCRVCDIVTTQYVLLVVPLPKSFVLYRIQEELREVRTWGGKRLSPYLPFGLTRICVYSFICPAYTFREMGAESVYPRRIRNIGLSVIIAPWEVFFEH